jgi:hypothetical protein
MKSNKEDIGKSSVAAYLAEIKKNLDPVIPPSTRIGLR